MACEWPSIAPRNPMPNREATQRHATTAMRTVFTGRARVDHVAGGLGRTVVLLLEVSLRLVRFPPGMKVGIVESSLRLGDLLVWCSGEAADSALDVVLARSPVALETAL